MAQPVLLLHGLMMRRPGLLPLALRLRRRGFAPVLFSYSSLWQAPALAIERLSMQLAAFGEQPVHLVAHHQGGKCRWRHTFVEEQPDKEIGRSVDRRKESVWSNLTGVGTSVVYFKRHTSLALPALTRPVEFGRIAVVGPVLQLGMTIKSAETAGDETNRQN